ncbi:MAG TPA: 3-oxoacyl-ACP synthase [Marinilabiliaceae bacterium]|nr:3-oxoacyl-ACP synthase [Marinilabiliaceae bacterium]
MSSQKSIYAVITGTGSYIPPIVVKNSEFENNVFMDEDGSIIETPGKEITAKFEQITDIIERRIAPDNILTSDMATMAAQEAIDDAGIDKETLDYIIVAHNLGDVKKGTLFSDIIPTLASRVKHNLDIKNPMAVAYDLTFGCPGWTQAMIQANYFIKSGDAKRILVIGADSISRMTDPHDRDIMIFADGASATILEGVESEEPVGMLKHSVRTDAIDYLDLLQMGNSYNPELKGNYLKMLGRKVYNYALSYVPLVAQDCLNKNEMQLKDVSKILIHQANAKMDEAILKRIFRLYGKKEMDSSVMPMTIRNLGNSSVATVPTLFDLILKGKLEGHELKSGDNVMMTSVGAGMNINAFMYKMP